MGNGSGPRRPGGKWTATPAAERLRRYFTEGPPDACWPWTGATDRHGHGQFHPSANKTIRAHRAVYELLVGPIPKGMTLDHLCHSNDRTCEGGATCPHRICVNPAHMEPVTLGENKRRGMSPPAVNARKTHCIRGHELTPDNLVTSKLPWRKCRTCHRDEMRRYYARRKSGA